MYGDTSPYDQPNLDLSQFLPKYDKCTSSALGEGAETQIWRLQTLAVDPEHQRQGIGRLLVNSISDMPIWVDCSEEMNVSISHHYAACSESLYI